MNADRDIVARLEAIGLRYYVTGSWALAAYAEPRMTRDIDIVLEATATDYERVIRPAFEDDFLVNDPIVTGGRSIGRVIHRTEIARADLIFGRSDPWARSALDRRRRFEHPALGPTWIISPEDLILAKLEWSNGGASELQLRDVRSIVRLADDLDWRYVEQYAAILGVQPLLEVVHAG
ncbi:MAG TPA: hypothetical protein VFR14_10400 [Candidatus Limnocylindrales bacterium]|nr:hypothetical protein [Candidatus Limnocylindrales bacterium]